MAAGYFVTINGKAYDVVVEKKNTLVGGNTVTQVLTDESNSQKPIPSQAVIAPSTDKSPVEHKDVSVSAGAGHTVNAPMPGKVIAVKVNVGDPVEKNQEVIIIEAMKMHNPLLASTAGIVKAIYVEPGASVKVEQALIQIG